MKKIMFSDFYGLTKAVLEGRKTQTRRIAHISRYEFDVVNYEYPSAPLGLRRSILDISKYKINEIIAIAQSYKDIFTEFSQNPNQQLNIGVKNPTDTAGWTNKMLVKGDLMPHQIRITDVCIQRLQDISDEDCLKEGVVKGRCGSEDTHFMDAYYVPNEIQPYCTPREVFARLIDKVSGKGTWQNNPFVWVYDFELVK